VGHQVSHSWVAGKPLLADSELLTMNEQSLIQSANNWRNKISS
jgi:5-methylthioadenosine/S-adenosylhomocysteine deaminase